MSGHAGTDAYAYSSRVGRPLMAGNVREGYKFVVWCTSCSRSTVHAVSVDIGDHSTATHCMQCGFIERNAS